MSDVNAGSTHAAVTRAIAEATRAWGKPTRARTSGQGVVATFAGIEGDVGARISEFGGKAAVSVAAPSRRNGPDDRRLITGEVNDNVHFFAHVRKTDQPTCEIDIHFFPAAGSNDPHAPLGGMDPLVLFQMFDQIAGGATSARALLPAYVAYHCASMTEKERSGLMADMAQLVADTLREMQED